MNIPTPQQIKAYSVGSTFWKGKMMAQYSSEVKAKQGRRLLTSLGFSTSDIIESNTTGRFSIVFWQGDKENPRRISTSARVSKEYDLPRFQKALRAANMAGNERLARIIRKDIAAMVKASKPRSNPAKVMIYDQVIRITARKGQKHRCDPGCKASDHRYFHDFKPGARMYGLPDKSILIKG